MSFHVCRLKWFSLCGNVKPEHFLCPTTFSDLFISLASFHTYPVINTHFLRSYAANGQGPYITSSCEQENPHILWHKNGQRNYARDIVCQRILVCAFCNKRVAQVHRFSDSSYLMGYELLPSGHPDTIWLKSCNWLDGWWLAETDMFGLKLLTTDLFKTLNWIEVFLFPYKT